MPALWKGCRGCFPASRVTVVWKIYIRTAAGVTDVNWTASVLASDWQVSKSATKCSHQQQQQPPAQPPPPPSLSVSVLGDDDEDAVRLSALGSINHTSFLFFSDSIPWFHVVQCAVVPLFPFSIDDRNVNGQIIIISEWLNEFFFLRMCLLSLFVVYWQRI